MRYLILLVLTLIVSCGKNSTSSSVGLCKSLVNGQWDFTEDYVGVYTHVYESSDEVSLSLNEDCSFSDGEWKGKYSLRPLDKGDPYTDETSDTRLLENGVMSVSYTYSPDNIHESVGPWEMNYYVIDQAGVKSLIFENEY